jgi:hypothetical protein
MHCQFRTISSPFPPLYGGTLLQATAAIASEAAKLAATVAIENDSKAIVSARSALSNPAARAEAVAARAAAKVQAAADAAAAAAAAEAVKPADWAQKRILSPQMKERVSAVAVFAPDVTMAASAEIEHCIAHMSSNDSSFVELRLVNNGSLAAQPGSDRDATFRRIARALTKSTTVKDIAIINCGGTDALASALAAVVEQNSNIQTLNLESNGVEEAGLLSLAAALRTSKTLKELRLMHQKKRMVRCAFFGRNLHSRMPLDPTHVRLKRTRV